MAFPKPSTADLTQVIYEIDAESGLAFVILNRPKVRHVLMLMPQPKKAATNGRTTSFGALGVASNPLSAGISTPPGNLV